MDNLRFKFRSWCRTLKQFQYFQFDLKESSSLPHSNWYNEKEPIQQSTGLKDKNGKLIFEGDIIVIPNQYPFYDYKDRDNKKIDLNETCGKIMGESVLNYIGIVEWIYSSWQYVYHCVNPQKQGISEGINNLLNEIGYEDGQKTEFEIIGNIYENKELLKE